MYIDIDELFEFENKVITKTMLSTEYYDTYNNIVRLYNKFLHGSNFNAKALKYEVEKLNIGATCIFFKKHKTSLRSLYERQQLDDLLGYKGNDYYSEHIFNINKFNFEELLKISKLYKVNIQNVHSVTRMDTDISKLNQSKFIRFFQKDGKYANVVFIKHMNSVEYYNIKTYRTVAFKNYSNGATFGLWNNQFETLTKQMFYLVLKSDKDRREKLFESVNAHKFNKLLNEVHNNVGYYTRQYANDIFEYAIKEMQTISCSDLDDLIDISVRNAIKNLCKADSKVAEAFRVQEETDELERQRRIIEANKKKAERENRINKINQEKLEREEELLQQEEEQRQLEVAIKKQAELDKQAELIRQRAEDRVKQQDKIREREEAYAKQQAEIREQHKIIDNIYQLPWASYEDEYYRKVSGLAVSALPSKYSNMHERIGLISLRKTIIDDFNVNKDSNNKKIYIFHTLEKEVLKDIDPAIVRSFIDNKDKKGLEDYLRGILGMHFVRMVNRKDVDRHLAANPDLKTVYLHYGGQRHFRTRNGVGTTSLNHNAPKERGSLWAYGNIFIDGGENDKNQTQIKLFICNEAFQDLRCLMGKEHPNSSEYNTFIETNILYAKSQRPDAFYVREDAMITYTVNRDSREFTDLTKYKTTRDGINIYIPCEYAAYIKYVYNQCTHRYAIAKESNQATLNMLIYEYLMYKLNKSYSYKF